MKHIDFVKAFIEAKKAENKAKGLHFVGVHTVISGFNEEFRTLFGSQSMTKEELRSLPITAMMVLSDKGEVVIVPASRGAMLYLPEDYKPRVEKVKKSREDIMLKYGFPPIIAATGEVVAQGQTGN